MNSKEKYSDKSFEEWKNSKRYIVCTRNMGEVTCTEEDAWNDFVSSDYDYSVLQCYTTVKETCF